MTGLSLSAINATSPYQLRVSELGGFDFDIEAGLTYNIALIEDYTFGEGFESCMKLFVRPLNSLTKIFIRKNLGIFMLQIININDLLGLPDFVFQ